MTKGLTQDNSEKFRGKLDVKELYELPLFCFIDSDVIKCECQELIMIMITTTTATITVNRTLALNMFLPLIMNIWLCLHFDIYLCLCSQVI